MHFGKNVIIHSFEPSLETFEKLKLNIGDKDGIHIQNIGLGENETTMTLFSNKSTSTIASLYNRNLDHINVNMKALEIVTIKTIDNYCQENCIDKIDFLKIDVEGHELSVLKGAKKMILEGNIEAIQFEFGGCNLDSRTFFKDFFLMLNTNYKLYRIVQNGLYPIKNYKEIYEVFYTVNFFAELK